jgi:hypothetical protein
MEFALDMVQVKPPQQLCIFSFRNLLKMDEKCWTRASFFNLPTLTLRSRASLNIGGEGQDK